jgi:hypothetical protein
LKRRKTIVQILISKELIICSMKKGIFFPRIVSGPDESDSVKTTSI